MKTSIKEKLHELVETMIDQMENGDGTWIKSWSAPNGFPTNFISKKRYRGFNVFNLSMVGSEKGYASPYWLTFKQAKSLGGKVKKGEKATDIFFYKLLEKKNDKDNEQEDKYIPILKMYKVFNIEQTEGIEYKLPELKTHDNNRYENAEDFIIRTGANVINKGFEAFYSPREDKIQMPEIKFFNDSDNYYATLLHELTHWTGATTRLNRKEHTRWGDETYAFEELIAELGSVFLCSHLGISIEKNRHPEYLKGWIRGLRKDPYILWKAASQSQKAFDYLLELNETQEKVA